MPLFDTTILLSDNTLDLLVQIPSWYRRGFKGVNYPERMKVKSGTVLQNGKIPVSSKTASALKKFKKKYPDNPLVQSCLDKKANIKGIVDATLLGARKSDHVSRTICQLLTDDFKKSGLRKTLTLQQANRILNLQHDQLEAYDKKTRFLIQQLQASLLQDINEKMFEQLDNTTAKTAQEKEAQKSFWNKVKLGGLLLAGTVFTACEGFDGIAAILGLASAIPAAAVAAAGGFFAIVSVMVFYGFEVAEISKHLGVGLKDATRLIDVYLKQVEAIKQQIKLINDAIHQAKSRQELESLLSMLDVLERRHGELQKTADVFDKKLNSKGLEFAKGVAAVTAGVLFASSGFFAGQAVALFLMGAAVSALNPVVLCISIAVAICAFAVYWYVERPGLEKLVSRKLGVDPDKINAFTKQVKPSKKNEQELTEEESIKLDCHASQPRSRLAKNKQKKGGEQSEIEQKIAAKREQIEEKKELLAQQEALIAENKELRRRCGLGNNPLTTFGRSYKSANDPNGEAVQFAQKKY